MRWFWIDRFTEFISGKQAAALKSVTITEEHLDEYFAGYPVMTPSFVLEGFAQMGGLLIGEPSAFRANVVLAKISRSIVHHYARPGDRLTYRVEVRSLQQDGGLVHATSHNGERLQLEADLTFAHVSRAVKSADFFDPAEFLRMLRIFRLYDVGVDSAGNPLNIPEHLLEAERKGLR